MTRLMSGAALGTMAAAMIATSSAALAQDAPVVEDGNTIIVTANKREQDIRDTPLAISAVTGEALAEANANSLSDYIVRLPGVVFNDYQPGVSEVVIRGIAATTYHEQGQTTVGYYINEIPVVEPGWPIGIPDVDTFDLDRVEVLRGPQGTLFGSSTLGGLVNYIVKTADPSRFDAAASGLIGYTENAGQANYAIKGMVNVPIIADKLAVRVSAFQRFEAGFADNTGTGIDGANDFRVRGGRGSIVFTPGEGTKLTYFGMYQETRLDDQTYLTSIADLTRVTSHAEKQETTFFLNSLRLDQEIGDVADLTVFGSVNYKTNHTLFDSSWLGYLTGNTSGPDAPYSPGYANANIKQGEVRLTSSGTGPLRWLVGASYLKAAKFGYDRTIAPGAEAVIGSVLAPNDRVYGYISDSENEDFGVFGELSFRPIPELEITVGGRYYDTKARATVTNQAGFTSGSTVDLSGSVNQSENGFTPKATISFRPADGFLAYMTYSRGYRVGGINPNAGLLPTIPTAYDSDAVDNFEAGVKFGLFDNALLIDATVFNIDWHDIQARLFGPAPNYYSYVVNAASANIAGIEFAATVRPSRNIAFSTNITYQDANLTDFLPDTFAAGGGYASGSTLPGSSEWSVANNLVFEFPDHSVAPRVELAHRYISSAPVAFGNPTTRGDFSQFDVRASIKVVDKLSIMAFANNIFDKRGLLSGPFAAQTAPAFSIIRPRTIGLRVDFGL